jgi:hypothetical protein
MQIEGQITWWPIEKGQKNKQRSTKYTHKTKHPQKIRWFSEAEE